MHLHPAKRLVLVGLLAMSALVGTGANLAASGALSPGAPGLRLPAFVVQAQGPPPSDDSARQVLLLYPDTVLVNGKILTADGDTPDFTIAEALAIRDGKVLAVGSSAQIRALAGPRTVVRDLAGRTVVPGLVDTHVHIHESAPTRWLD